MLDFLVFKGIGFFSPIIQNVLVISLFSINFAIQKREHEKTGKTFGRYPWRISVLTSSIYEEIIFRGFILFYLLTIVPNLYAIIISSVLFGLWHIKNIKWQTRNETIKQVLYTGIIFGPIASFITIYTGTIWLAVILHYLHNLVVFAIFKKEQPTPLGGLY